MRRITLATALLVGLAVGLVVTLAQERDRGRAGQHGELPAVASVDGDPIRTLLPPDAIPAIDDPRFVPAAEARFMRDDEPVVGVVVDGLAKAYSLWHLDHHEIVNDRFGDAAVAVTW